MPTECSSGVGGTSGAGFVPSCGGGDTVGAVIRWSLCLYLSKDEQPFLGRAVTQHTTRGEEDGDHRREEGEDLLEDPGHLQLRISKSQSWC